MTERLSGLLTRSGYERYYESNLWLRKAADGRIVSRIFLGTQAANMYPNPDRFVYEGDMKDLPSLLSALTPREILRIIDGVERDIRDSTKDPEEISGALEAIEMIRKRLWKRVSPLSMDEALRWIQIWILRYSDNWEDPIDSEEIREDVTLDFLTLDQYDANELSRALEKEFGIRVAINRNMTIGEIAALLAYDPDSTESGS